MSAKLNKEPAITVTEKILVRIDTENTFWVSRSSRSMPNTSDSTEHYREVSKKNLADMKGSEVIYIHRSSDDPFAVSDFSITCTTVEEYVYAAMKKEFLK